MLDFIVFKCIKMFLNVLKYDLNITKTKCPFKRTFETSMCAFI